MTKEAEIDAEADRLPSACALRLAPRSGARDAALFDIVHDPARGRARQVTAALEAGFLAPSDADGPGWARTLSIPDRQIALMRLALEHGAWPAWFVATCEACSTAIDLRIGADEFTIVEALQPTLAQLRVEGPGGGVILRMPAGAQEEALLDGPPGTTLLSLCGLPDDADPEDWEAAVSAAMAPLLPSITAELRFPCPDCGDETGWWFDPLPWIARHTGGCFAEIDLLARRYGWSEAEILALPTARRQVYLSMAGASA